jgi:predicted metal-dependent hydrolase
VSLKKTARQLSREIAEHVNGGGIHARVQRLIDKWQPKIGVRVADWQLKKMGRYWGSADKETRTIWINPDLGRLPPAYLEYVVVHELVHLLTNGHDRLFYELMDRHLPRWRRLQARIEEPLTS